MERREFIKAAAGTAFIASPALSVSGQANPFLTEANAAEIKMTQVSQDVQNGTSPGPNPYPNVEIHPGWVRSGSDDTPGPKAYYIHLEAKAGRGNDVQNFLKDILAGVEQEPGTGPWFGLRFSDTVFGIFEAFPDKAARDAHDIGPGGRNFLRVDRLHEMLAHPAHIYRLDVMFGKFGVMFGKNITAN